MIWLVEVIDEIAETLMGAPNYTLVRSKINSLKETVRKYSANIPEHLLGNGEEQVCDEINKRLDNVLALAVDPMENEVEISSELTKILELGNSLGE